MTDLEQASLDAFNDLVLRGGKTFLVATKSVQGVAQFIEPENAERTLEQDEGQDAIVRVLKSDWPAGSNQKGTSFEITAESLNFRIKNSRQDPLFYTFRCKVY